jgi:hypothetical protein
MKVDRAYLAVLVVGQDLPRADRRHHSDAAADELLGRDPLALMIGMLLDQHMRQRNSEVQRCSAVTLAGR